ncbi:death ligand signal enhancer [Engraulis encrasicolus]|uniref:death ligand signal enhancer n=1 Tax=Engraulis encrasicolus TaxID=184585 RepID=UPI002FD4024F
MWRVQGIVGRALYRWHANNTPLRLSHREDEVINTSSLLSTNFHSSDNREEGEERRRKRTSQFYYTGLPRYTALDAMGWGTAAVVFMQVCRRIHSHYSRVGDPSPSQTSHQESGLIRKCGYRILLDLISRQHDLSRQVLPGALSLYRQRGAPEYNSSISSSSSSSSSAAVTEHFDQQEALLSQELPLTEESFSDASVHSVEAKPKTQNEQDPATPEDSLSEAAENLGHVADSSIPVILNIIGLESARAGDHEAAFSCFLASAQNRYSKAQFNVGVCYEKGRGVRKNLNKALQFYRRAATSGHRQAQYRCAKLLLSSRRQQRAEEDQATAIALLEAAAAAGLTEAQLYLGVLLSQEPAGDQQRAVQYLRMAAQSGDSVGLLYLGQCYECGVGVKQCLGTAANLYRQAAAAGNQKAKGLLMDMCHREEDRVLRSIRSAPCFSALDNLTLGSVLSGAFQEASPTGQRQRSDWPVQPLPHSQSTGSLRVPPTHLYSFSGADNAPSKWTIGVG